MTVVLAVAITVTVMAMAVDGVVPRLGGCASVDSLCH